MLGLSRRATVQGTVLMSGRGRGAARPKRWEMADAAQGSGGAGACRPENIGWTLERGLAAAFTPEVTSARLAAYAALTTPMMAGAAAAMQHGRGLAKLTFRNHAA